MRQLADEADGVGEDRHPPVAIEGTAAQARVERREEAVLDESVVLRQAAKSVDLPALV